MNKQIAQHIINNLLLRGIRDFCICAGGRNVPLISALVSWKTKEDLNFYEFFDERSASFFALGRAKAIQKPVVLVSTSGTAVAETLPAMLEAKHSNVPVIILSADRPKAYRNFDTPQTTNQHQIFKFLDIHCWDLDQNNFQEFNFLQTQPQAAHINVSFADPIVFSGFDNLPKLCLSKTQQAFAKPKKIDNLSAEDSLYIAQFLSRSKKPVVLVSKLNATNKKALINFLLKLNTFIYLESGSQLQGERKLELLLLKAGEKSLEKAFDDKLFDAVIKIGSTPAIKFWRLLEDQFSTVPVLSIIEHGESGLSRLKKTINIDNLLNTFHNFSLSSLGVSIVENSLWKAKIKTLDKGFYEHKQKQYKAEPFSEASLVKQMGEVFSAKDNIFLGNSLSIRYWDSMVSNKPFASIESHRGLNGIDGLVSGFLGWVSGLSDTNKAWAILGDLSSLYDLNALWISRQLKNKNWSIIVINNFGGKIFNSLFNQEILEARHNLNFQHWAKMFNCSYVKIEAKDFANEFNQDLKGIIEIIPQKNTC